MGSILRWAGAGFVWRLFVISQFYRLTRPYDYSDFSLVRAGFVSRLFVILQVFVLNPPLRFCTISVLC